MNSKKKPINSRCKSRRREKYRGETSGFKRAEEKKALALQQDQARQEALNKDYLHIQTLTEKLLTKLNAQAVLEKLKFR
ncbi:hypothetical protein [Candidatus Bealeia paramacronuclearis]|uniref:hypothetical protein n=1 Tax=Candidatus Bealeia paramacronuclearis TaxID=1921001 RepID=UPI0030CC275A